MAGSQVMTGHYLNMTGALHYTSVKGPSDRTAAVQFLCPAAFPALFNLLVEAHP